MPSASPAVPSPGLGEDRLIPLLALAQAAALIDHVASTGTVDQEAMSHLLDCLLQEEARPAALGEAEDLRIGRRVLLDMLSGDLPDKCIPAYMRAMARQERRLSRRPDLGDELRRRLARARHMREHFASEPASVHAAVAGAYGDTVARVASGVRVVGALRQLADKRNGDIIRCALLGGIQAAELWRLQGGRLWQLRWNRRRLLKRINDLPFKAGE